LVDLSIHIILFKSLNHIFLKNILFLWLMRQHIWLKLFLIKRYFAGQPQQHVKWRL